VTTPASVVFDVNILVGAALGGTSPFRSWPAVPPTTNNPYADCMGIIVDAREFGLFVSPHIVDNTKRVLANVLKWEEPAIQQFLKVLAETVVNSGGDVVDPPRQVHDCHDYEDNHILDLALEVGALLVVSNDSDLISMNPWRGTPILQPREFAARVDGMRRHQRRRHR
jgi:putative PIN family toxin of toxin-antitoxin system